MTTNNTLSQEFCALIDWARPDLAPLAVGDDETRALALIRHLRERPRPVLGYPAEVIAAIRAAATPEAVEKANTALETTFTLPLVSGVHNSQRLAHAAGPCQLAGTPEFFRALATSLVADRDGWDQGGWGTTHSICAFLQHVWALEECPDDALVPVFVWLHTQLQAEWAWSRTWGEALLGTSGHNWWLHTFPGFWKAGLFFPEVRDFAQFASFAPTYLEREMALLMEPDGFTKERSGYHWGTARMFMEYAQLAEQNGITLSDGYYAKLRAIAGVNWKLVTPDGDVPLVGDTSPCGQAGRIHGLLRQEAALYGIAEAKYVAEVLSPGWAGALRFHGVDLQPAYEALAPAAPARPDTELPHSGYYVMRENWTTQSDWALIDAGARGNTVTSHDHTALFHLLLCSKGRHILVDNCSGPYGDEPSRTWRVGSAGHNVTTVDGLDNLPMRNEWRWESVVMPTVEAWTTAPAYAYFSGAHEGYARPIERVSGVRRKLFYLRGGYWILLDRFTAPTPAEAHDYQLHFQLGVPADLGEDGRVTTSGEGGNLIIAPVPGAEGAALLKANPFPLEGYDNPAHLCYTRAGRGHDLMATLLVPFTGAAPTVSATLLPVQADGRTLSAWEATGLEIVIDGRRDVYVDLHMQWNLPWTCGGYAGDGRLFHSAVGAC